MLACSSIQRRTALFIEGEARPLLSVIKFMDPG